MFFLKKDNVLDTSLNNAVSLTNEFREQRQQLCFCIEKGGLKLQGGEVVVNVGHGMNTARACHNLKASLSLLGQVLSSVPTTRLGPTSFSLTR